MRSIQHILTLWEIGLLTHDEVVQWADAEIVRCDQPPSEVIDLSLHGPEECLNSSINEFPIRPIQLSYAEEFSLRALGVSLPSTSSVFAFVKWASRACLGRDLPDPMVLLSYQLNHLLNDEDDANAAIQLIRKELPSLLPACRQITEPFRDDRA